MSCDDDPSLMKMAYEELWHDEYSTMELLWMGLQ